MKVKYTDFYDVIHIRIPQIKDFMGSLFRNRWKEVPDDVAKYLVNKSPFFMNEDDVIFKPEQFKNLKNVALFRSGALGDLIQLIPVVKELRKHYSFKITLFTQDMYVEYMKQIRIFDDVKNQGSLCRKNYDKIIHLNGVLENDHSLNSPEHDMHRVKIYENFFKISIKNYEWDIELDKNVIKEVEKFLC